MYKVDPTLLMKFSSRVQTKTNNNDPRPLSYITRNKTAITSQRFWEKQMITSTVGTRSSVAVRRPQGSFLGDMIFSAQVESGDAVICYAEPKINLNDMDWQQLTVIPNVSELSIIFDGFMVMKDNIVETYTVGDLPWIFYVDSSNSLKGWNMNTDVTFTISDIAYNVASVRGLYSEAADLNDGIFVFYTNAEGELWEARVLGGEVVELTEITLLPDGVTGWEDIWASRTFDYRICLQIKGNDEKVYTLMSASRPSGFVLNEHLVYNIKLPSKPMLQCGLIPPTIIRISNTIIEPTKVIVEFDSEVFIFDTNLTKVWMLGGDGEKRYPISMIKVSSNILELGFTPSLVGLMRPHSLADNRYSPCGFGSIDGVSTTLGLIDAMLFGVDFSSMGEDVLDYNIKVASDPQLEVLIAFDGKGYTTDTIDYKIAVKTLPSMLVRNLSWEKGYYNGIDTITYNIVVKNLPMLFLLDINGNPI